MSYKPFLIKAVIFDFDGTLTKPGTLDFPSFKKSLGCPVDQPTLEYIENLTDPDRTPGIYLISKISIPKLFRNILNVIKE